MRHYHVDGGILLDLGKELNNCFISVKRLHHINNGLSRGVCGGEKWVVTDGLVAAAHMAVSGDSGGLANKSS